jgi:hypothetical protein
MKTYLFFLIGMCLFIINCNKHELKDKIIIGNKTDLLIKEFDTVLIGGYHNFISFDINVDGDNSPDFQLTSGIWGAPGIGQYPQSKLSCLKANCLINGFISLDTTFINYQTDTSYGQNMSKIYIYKTTIYSCKRLDKADSLKEINQHEFKLLTKKKGDYLNKSETFHSDTVILSDEWYSNFVVPEIHKDTIIHNYFQQHNTCSSFPPDMIRYIGIKIKDSGIEKIGWIKIGIFDNYKVAILESAIQK